MQEGQPSRTALGAAVHRAAHQVLEGGSIFADPLALRILGAGAESAVRAAGVDPARRRLRIFVAFRSSFAEDALRRAFEGGVRQLVVLGAGLDTYAYRNPLGEALRMYEVDHPATQAWKRRRLAEEGITVPGNLALVPVDFERESLADALAGAGFDPVRPAFFSWLGVVPYLTGEAVFSTLGFIAALPGGAQVVFDYGNPAAPGAEADRRELARRVASVGEALRSEFETGELHARLAGLGFKVLEDLGPARIRERILGVKDDAPDRGGHVLLVARPSVCGS
jgi:methyltransferase (TIGR00027 family)